MYYLSGVHDTWGTVKMRLIVKVLIAASLLLTSSLTMLSYAQEYRPTATSLNPISTPLIPGQTDVPWSGMVSALFPPPYYGPDGVTVWLQHRDGDCFDPTEPPDEDWNDWASAVTSNGDGAFSGTFTAPSGLGYHAFRARFPGVPPPDEWEPSTSGCRTVEVSSTVQISFASNGIDADTGTSTIVTVNGVDKTQSELSFTASYDIDESITYSYASPVGDGLGKQYVWTSTSGLGQTLQSNTFTVTAGGTVTGSYETQYYLTVNSAHDSPTPTSGWFDSGASVTAHVTSPADESVGTRYRCTGWSGTGSVPASGTDTTMTFAISAPSSITWNWIAQSYLELSTDPRGLALPTDCEAGWYDGGTVVTCTAQVVPGYTFSHWVVDGVDQPEGVMSFTLTISSRHTATAIYTGPVGGFAASVNKLAILSPYLILLGLVGAALMPVARKRRRKR